METIKNQIYYSPDAGGGKKEKEIEEEKELKEIKEKVVTIDPRQPNYEGVGLGVEITTEGFKGINLDHHKEGDTIETPSAIEQALEFDISKIPEGKIATVRPDPDSLGAIAVLRLKQLNFNPDETLVRAIGFLDRMGPAVFKTKAKEALNLSEEDFNKLNEKLRAIYYSINIKKAPIEEKVLFMEKMLLGKIPEEEIKKLYEEDKKNLEEAEKNSKIELISVNKENKAAFIESQHMRAMEIGYNYADIVIAYNPNFKWPNGNITPKYTISRRDKFVPFDMKKLLSRLKEKNPKWGGHENIIGSPQGEDPEISPEEIKALVKEILLESEREK